MRNLIGLCVALFFVAVTGQSFEGKWHYKDDGYRCSFVLTLQQKDSVITGDHSSVMLGGNRIDAAMDEQTVEGVVKDGEAIISIKSMYGLGTGKARLTFVGRDSIHFKFIEEPEGEYYLPDDVVMVRRE